MGKRGMTLIELVLAFGLLGTLMAGVNVLLFTALRNARKAQAVGTAKIEGAYALNAMTQYIKFAKTITCASGAQLDLYRYNGDNMSYRLNAGAIASESATLAMNLTSPKVVATTTGCAAVFTCSAGSRVVDICFTVSAANTATPDEAGSVTMKSRITLRDYSE